MILRFTIPGIQKTTVQGPSTGKSYRMMTHPSGYRLLYDVHPDDAAGLKTLHRKGKQLWVDFEQPTQPKPAVVVTPPPAAVLPDTPTMPSSVWDDVPDPGLPKDPISFEKVKDFNSWLLTKPDMVDLQSAKRVERDGKNRKTIISGINKALNG